MKKTILALVLAVSVILSSLSFAAAATGEVEHDPNVPDRVLESAVNEGLPFVKGFMKDPEYGFIGTAFKTAEEVDSATLACIYPSYPMPLSPSVYDREQEPALYSWFCVVNGSSGPAATFKIRRGSDGSLSHGELSLATNYAAAESIMKKLAKRSGTAYEPYMLDVVFTDFLAVDFGGDVRVIPVHPDGYALDRDYYMVQSYEELPSLDDLEAALEERIAWGKEHPDQDGGYLLFLKPHLESKPGFTRLAITIAASAAVIALAVLAAVTIRRKIGLKAKH